MSPAFVTAARNLLAAGWKRNGYGGLIRNDLAVCWDWSKPGAEPSVTAPDGAVWSLEVSRKNGSVWDDLLICQPDSVEQALRYLTVAGILPEVAE